MVDDEGDQGIGTNQTRTFFVRLRSDDTSQFAVCERIGTADGDSPVPGTGKTVAQLVTEQALLAAAAPPGSQRDLPELIDDAATGANLGSGIAPGG